MFNFYTFGGSAGRFLSIRPTPRNMLKTIINPNVIPAPCTMLASIHAPKDGCCDCCCCCCCSGIGAGGGRANASGGACCVRSFFRIAFEVTSASLSGACGSLEKARAKRTPCPARRRRNTNILVSMGSQSRYVLVGANHLVPPHFFF